MIKRRFYRFEHANRDAPSESSSSSESEVEVEAEASDDTEIEEEEENEEENVTSHTREKGEASSSSGYESEDSSVNEVNLDSSGLPTSDDDVATQSQNIIGSFSGGEGNNLPTLVQHSPKNDDADFKMTGCVLKCKSVFKCKLCPRIVCLSEETLKAHLASKKHARSEKLHKEGRLKLMLNDDGEIEGEAHFENAAAATVSEQKSPKPNKKGRGRLKQRKRQRQDTESRKAKSSAGKREKRRKTDD